MSVWTDGLWMLGDGPDLGDELERTLAAEPVGLSCDELAMRLRRRRAEVLAVLRADPRFEHVGGGRGSRWMPVSDPWDGLGRKDRGRVDQSPIRGQGA
jgi:hypothetical protein